jgi:hypothetical protein
VNVRAQPPRTKRAHRRAPPKAPDRQFRVRGDDLNGQSVRVDALVRGDHRAQPVRG